MYGVGIVGCGVIGTRLAAAFDEHERTAVRVACDRDAERARGLAAEYDCAAVTSVDEILGVGDVDVVYVGVPPKHHAPVVRAALAADRDVICEKPIAETAAVGRELTALAEDSGRVTAINFPFRYTPGFLELRERVASGAIGRPLRVSLRFRFPRWPREWQDVAWLEGREQGGPLREVGSHFVFGTLELFGAIGGVHSRVRWRGAGAAEESIVATFLAGAADSDDMAGAAGSGDDAGAADPGDGAGGFEGTALDDSPFEPVESEPVHGTIDLLCDGAGREENSLIVEGTEGSLALREWRRLVADPGEDDERVITAEPGETSRRLIDEFVTAMDGEDGDLVSFEAATRVQAVVDEVLGIDAP